MARFEGIDFYDIDSLLTEEERMVRDTIRTWVEDRLMPIIGPAYIERRFPKEIIPELAELGVLGANLPEKYGCAELNNVSYGLIMQELERGDSGVRSFASVQGALVMYPIFAFGSESQRQEWLPKLAAGEAMDYLHAVYFSPFCDLYGAKHSKLRGWRQKYDNTCPDSQPSVARSTGWNLY